MGVFILLLCYYWSKATKNQLFHEIGSTLSIIFTSQKQFSNSVGKGDDVTYTG